MYKFADTTPGSADTDNLVSIQTVFNNINLDEEINSDDVKFTTLTVTGRDNLNQRINTIPVTGMDGVLEEGNPTINDKQPIVKFRLKTKTNEQFRDALTNLKSLLVGSKKTLKFTDENVIHYATLRELEVPEEESNDMICNLEFQLSDPYKYGPEQENELKDISVIENKGTAPAEPIFELTAKKKSTFALVSLGADEDSEYNLIGTPTEVDEKVVDTKRTIFEERGQTLDQWTSAGTEVDGTVSGELNTDNDGITVPSYGNGSAWHGPALMREINPIQDFEVEMMLRGETRNDSQTMRIEFYLFDENMNNLGKMGIMDNSTSVSQKKGEGRFGKRRGRFENYIISSRNYKYRTKMWFGMLRMTREGNKMTFYISRVNNRNQHVKSLEESVIIDDDLMGKLKYVQIHIGKYSGTGSARAPRILSIKANELYERTVDETPYILYPDDVVTFDHKNEDLLINGEPRNDLKNFGGSFFNLNKGFNNIVIIPSDTFDTTLKFRDKFR